MNICIQSLLKIFVIVTVIYVSIDGASTTRGLNSNCTEAPSTCTMSLYGRNGQYQELLETWIETDFKIPSMVDKISICLNLKLLRIFNSNDKNFNVILEISTDYLLFVSENHVKLSSNTGRDLVSSRSPVKVRTWMSICVVIGDSIKLFVDGEESLNSISYLANPFKAGLYTLSIGLNRRHFTGKHRKPVSMKFSAPQIVLKELTDAKINSFSKCNNDWQMPEVIEHKDWRLMRINSGVANEITTIPFSLDSKENNFNATRNCQNAATIQDLNSACSALEPTNSDFNFEASLVSDICTSKSDSFFAIVDGEFTYEEAERACELLKGEIISDAMHDLSEKIKELMKSSLLPNTFAYIKNKNGTSYCEALSIKKGTMVFVPIACCSCTQFVNTICKVSAIRSFHLRTYKHININFDTVVTGFFDDTFFIDRDTIGALSMVSITGAHLRRTEKYFTCTNKIGFNMSLTDTADPFGLKTWSISLPQQANTGVLTDQDFIFSGCDWNEFTCNNGHCIPLQHRCNGLIDCLDGSDEECKILQQDLQEDSTLVHMPPKTFTPLSLTINVVRVESIFETKQLINIRLKLQTSWKDQRLHFFQLQPETEDNIIPNTIWKPTYQITNALLSDWRKYLLGNLGSEKMNVIREKNIEPSISPMGQEGYSYNGQSDSSIMRTEEFVVGIVCEFELSLFPFDVHECQFNISVVNKGSSTVYFDIDALEMKSRQEVLTRFLSSTVHFNSENHKKMKNATVLSFSIIFERRYGSYYLTTFLPCFLIGILVSLTFVFEVDDFMDRILVTLSGLIVLASLFAQFSYDLPDSPVPKAIEVFFFFYIIKLSYVFICHTITCMIRIREEKIRIQLRNFAVNEVLAENKQSIELQILRARTVHRCKTVAAYSRGRQHIIAKRAAPRKVEQDAACSNIATNLTLLYFGLGCELLFIGAFTAYISYSRNLVFERVNFEKY